MQPRTAFWQHGMQKAEGPAAGAYSKHIMASLGGDEGLQR